MAEPVFYPVIEQEKCPTALKEYIGSTELKNYYVSTEAWTTEPVFHPVSKQEEYPVKNYSVFTEAWTTEPGFPPISGLEERRWKHVTGDVFYKKNAEPGEVADLFGCLHHDHRIVTIIS